MIKPPPALDALIQSLCDALPLKNGYEQCGERMKGILKGFFEDANVVTREEFDKQVKILDTLQNKITRLEETLSSLEK